MEAALHENPRFVSSVPQFTPMKLRKRATLLPALEHLMIRALFAYIFVFTGGLACAAAYFYNIHPEHAPEDDMPRMRIDLEEALERARRAKDAFEAPLPPSAEPQKPAAPKGKTANAGASQVKVRKQPPKR
jgi:hypothetical protein